MNASARISGDRTGPRLYVRQRRLLALLDALGGKAGKRDFQKLLFLLCQELLPAYTASGAAGLYEFVPYRYGAFSFTSYADGRRLADRGLLIDDDRCWSLTQEGKRVVREIQDNSMLAFVRRYNTLRGDTLIAETYRRYPYYATRSCIVERVLAGDEVALGRIRAAQPEERSVALLTIGYEGRTLESYLNELIQSNVSILCDVRRNPISRKYGFSKSTLATSCDGVGIQYQHMPELGIGSRHRRGLTTQADFDRLFAMYKRRTLPMQGGLLSRIHAWLRMGKSVALTCYEREASLCHRRHLADKLVQMRDQLHLSTQSARADSSEKFFTARHL